MKEVPLSRGMVAFVDDADFPLVSRHCWTAHKGQTKWYARACIKVGGRWRWLYMHRFLTDAKPGAQVDHRDGNGLNNARSNLRLATHAGNQRNRGPWKGRRYKGVHWDGPRKKWSAWIKADGKRYYLGRFERPEDAARAYNEAARRLHGEFAYQNDVPPKTEEKADGQAG